MSDFNNAVVNQAVVDVVGAALPAIMSGNGVSAVLLIERSGMILTHAGEPPLHPDHMATVAASIFSAMKTLIKATRSEEFLVTVPNNGTILQFNQVDSTIILVGYYQNGPMKEQAAATLRDLAERARDLLTTDQTQDRRLHTGDFIIDKLNELFR